MRNDCAAWPQKSGSDFQTRFLAQSAQHSVQSLLYYKLKSHPEWPAWPPLVRKTLAQQWRVQATYALLRQQELHTVLEKLAQHDVIPLLMKGVPLNYSHYPLPGLRTCVDTDLLIAWRDFSTVNAVLTKLGYSRLVPRGKLISYQASCNKQHSTGIHLELDVHWRINSHQIFARCFDYETAFQQAIALPTLSPHAKALNPVHALVVLCINLASDLQIHFFLSRNRIDRPNEYLKRLYDIHLILCQMSETELEEFIDLVSTTKIKTVCHYCLQQTQLYFATQIPSPVIQRLMEREIPEPSARYLSTNRIQGVLTDLQAFPNWQQKTRFLLEYAVPPPSYMLVRYSRVNQIWLPLLYPYHFFKNCWRILYSFRNRLKSIHLLKNPPRA